MSAAPEDHPALDADVEVAVGGFVLRAALRCPPGAVVAVLGPNGAGKTTLLRALAGLAPLTGGHVRVGGTTVADTSTRTDLPPERRGVGVVFQSHLLFPHLSALDNVAFGPRARGVPRAAARQRARAELADLGVDALADRRPAALSGGQAQRVALARALATGPDLLLLDEPFAALDAATRSTVRTATGRRLASYDGATLLVTHDPVDALVLADRVLVLEDGRVAQEGPTGQVARHPRTRYVASLVGLNLWRGTTSPDGRVDVGGGLTLASAEEPTPPVPPGSAVHVAVAPSAVALHPGPAPGSPRNGWWAVVREVEGQGAVVRVALDGPVPLLADVTPAAVADLELRPGHRVWAAVKATEVTVYDAR